MTPILERLEAVLAGISRRIVACSGGVDSLLLATVAHRSDPDGTVVAHAVTPAVPGGATGRVLAMATSQRWSLELVATAEFDDERYLSNPTNRCYYCKTHLYDALGRLAGGLAHRRGWQVVSGANRDDLGEYRPGLLAASEQGVRHPLIEAGLAKADVRHLARQLQLDFAELPATPCLASRLYTGTRVSAARLRSVDAGEELLRRRTGIGVVRCRLRGDEAIVEVAGEDRDVVTEALLEEVGAAMRAVEPAIGRVRLDDRPYRPGRAIIATGDPPGRE
jgi:uncharacterized protein